MESSGLQPLAALLLVFAFVFGALCWIRLLRLAFAQHLSLGLTAFFLPPVALLLLLPQRREQQALFVLALACIGFSILAGIFS